MPDKNDETLKLEDRTMALILTVCRFGTRGRVKKAQVEQMLDAISVNPEAGGEDDVITVSKSLLEHPIVSRISGELAILRTRVRERALPVKFLKRGIYLYSTAKIDAVEAFIKEEETAIRAALDQLEAEYEAIIETDRKRLEPRGLFDAADYPPISTLRARVKIQYRWAAFSAPTKMNGVSKAVLESERAKAKAMWAETFDSVRLMQCQIVEDLVTGIQATLRPGEDGKKKVLKQARVEKAQEFLRTFALDNVTGFEELAALVGKANAVLSGVDAEVIRTEDGYRARLDKTLTEIKSDLKPLVIEATRKVKLKD